MHLTLYVPGLLLPDEILSATVFDLTAPSLSLLLGRGQRQELASDWLARAFELAPPLPAAALRKVGAGGTAPGHWLCLDPVHWQIKRDGIIFADPAQLDISEEEAAALIEAVQPMFTAWGELSASSPQHWELSLSRSLLLETRPPFDAIGLPVDPALPAGLDGCEWRRLLAEAQTVLHAHRVNRQRETLGKPVVNSLWPWGLGSLPKTVQTSFDVVWSDDPVVAGLCTQACIPCLAPPASFQPATGAVLCRLDHLAQSAQAHDVLAWRAALLDIERDWLALAIAALKKGTCSSLRLVCTGSSFQGTAKCVVYSLVRGNLWRFWRPPLPLTALTELA